MCTQFNIFFALPPVSPRNYDILNIGQTQDLDLDNT
jgi:hypothetical protein